MNSKIFGAAILMVLAGATGGAQSDIPGVNPQAGIPSSQMPSVLAKVSFDQRLNEQLPLDLAFKDEEGRHVHLRDYFGARPVVMAFVYYECPMLCTQVLNGLTTSLTMLEETVGREFDVIAVSFDRRETPVLANGKKKSHLDRYQRPESANGWHFLTGDEASIKALTASRIPVRVGQQDAAVWHPSGIVIATPDGKLSRYFFGIEYPPVRQVCPDRSSAGRIGNVVDQLLLYPLSLRPCDRVVRLRSHECRETGWSRHPSGARGICGRVDWREKRAGQ